ncbi:MAG: helix-turn-helix domain-containing protein [Methylovulum sp.]|uniref:helix-turn-helix domain-containing protein n=1 Tax=Methylovulum sp. TaxID=1916980 RepID=UPI00260555FC|nr:helix-turn-helix domain-containing protein [Methylovulum sp.]MDD2722599.1 helix-turn-helix domain-containing protein [Methylovulum sp.]MDD5123803.1 helix-turn-helix domain-containing protein [Methylovulum sp.]
MEPTPIKASCPDCRLSELCLPYGLQRDEVKQLATIVKNQRLLQFDDFLYLLGEECRCLYAVKSGSFRSFIANGDGLEQTIGFYLPGEIMGLDALQHDRFSCSTIALETSTVCEVPLSRLNSLCNEIPGLQMQMMRILGKEIASDHDTIVLLGHRTAIERVATFLLMLSQRYAALGFSSTTFNLSMRRQDIANFLGLTIETVSRQLAELSKQGIITVKQRIIKINDLPSLKTIVNPCAGQQLTTA